MNNNPFQPTPLRPAPDPDEWAEYERANRRASDRYWGAIHRSHCACGRFARNVCAVCREETS